MFNKLIGVVLLLGAGLFAGQQYGYDAQGNALFPRNVIAQGFGVAGAPSGTYAKADGTGYGNAARYWRTALPACSASPCTLTTLTLPNSGFADASYTINCTPTLPAATTAGGQNLTLQVIHETATTAAVEIFPNGNPWPSTGFVNCSVAHD